MSYKIMKILHLSLLLMLSAGVLQAESMLHREAKVIFVSSEGLYLDSGVADSLTVGDTLSMGDVNIRIRELAGRSSLAEVLAPDSLGSIKTGDIFVLEKLRPEAPAAADETPAAEVRSVFTAAVDSVLEADALEPAAYRPPNRFHGRVRQTVYTGSESSAEYLTNISMNLKLRRPFPVYFSFNSSLRQSGGILTPRLYTAALGFTFRKDRYRVELGRIAPTEMAGLGAVDGASFSARPFRRWVLGAMGGMRVSNYDLTILADGFGPAYGVFAGYRGRAWRGDLSYLHEELPVTRYDIYMHPVKFEVNQEVIWSFRKRGEKADLSFRGTVIKPEGGTWTPQRLNAALNYRLSESITWSSSFSSRIIAPDTLITFSQFETLMADYSRNGIRNSLLLKAGRNIDLRVDVMKAVINDDGTQPDIIGLSGTWSRNRRSLHMTVNRIIGEESSTRLDTYVSSAGKRLRIRPGLRVLASDSGDRTTSPYADADFRAGALTISLRAMNTRTDSGYSYTLGSIAGSWRF